MVNKMRLKVCNINCMSLERHDILLTADKHNASILTQLHHIASRLQLSSPASGSRTASHKPGWRVNSLTGETISLEPELTNRVDRRQKCRVACIAHPGDHSTGVDRSLLHSGLRTELTSRLVHGEGRSLVPLPDLTHLRFRKTRDPIKSPIKTLR